LERAWPGINLDKLWQFPLEKIHGALHIGDPATFDGIEAVVTDPEMGLRGRSKTGKAWRERVLDQRGRCLACRFGWQRHTGLLHRGPWVVERPPGTLITTSAPSCFVSSYDEAVSDPRADVFGSGYWITGLFCFEH
jgi:hypothetical protein